MLEAERMEHLPRWKARAEKVMVALGVPPVSWLALTVMPLHLSRSLFPALLWLALASHASAQLTAHAGPDATICAGSPVTLGGANPTGGTGPYMYSWSPTAGLSDPNILHPICTATNTTVYTLTVTGFNGETATDEVTVTVKPIPAINLSCSNAPSSYFGGVLTFSVCGLGVNGYTLDFTDASTAMPGATFTVNWGNGQSDTYTGSGWTATRSFPFGLTTGSYTIAQPAPNGCTRTIPFHVFVGEVPLGGLSVVSNSSICTGGAISFEWNNFGTNPPGTLYIVNYGDGLVDTLPHPPQAAFSHTYMQSSCAVGGEYSIAWRITNPCDTRTGQIGQIRVSGTPQSAFSTNPNDTVCVNSTVTFTDASQGAQAPACTPPKHIWSIAPSTGWTTSGTLGSTSGQPQVPAMWLSGSANLPVIFNTPGTYTITNVVGNTCGTDTLVRTICVESPPQPGFQLSATSGCSPLNLTTVNTTASPNSCNTRYNWTVTTGGGSCGSTPSANFIGGTNAGSAAPQLQLAGGGSYSVRLQAINSCGSFPVEQQVDVGTAPQVALAAVPGICAGQTVVPMANFSACGTAITGYEWDFNGGAPGTATSQVPGTIAYPVAGNFTVAVTAFSACGNTTATTPLAVSPVPPAPGVGGPITACVGEDVQLTATGAPGTTLHWTGPGGFSATGSTVQINGITAAQQGVYTVVAAAGGCTGPAGTLGITVNPAPVLAISPTAPIVCAGDAVTLSASGGSNYQWSMGGNVIGTGSPFTFTPSQSGTVVLQGQSGGCTATTSTYIVVHELPEVDAGPDRTYCEGGQAQMIWAYTPGGLWHGSPYMTPAGSFTPSAQGQYTLVYTVVSPEGCSHTDTIQVTVTAPPPPASAGPDTTVCLYSAPLQYTGDPVGGYWNGDISLDGVFTPDETGLFTITYTLGSGSCTSTAQATITVLPLPVIAAGLDQQFCADAPDVPLNATPPGGSWSGPGVNGNSFSPQNAGPGPQPYLVQYTYTDANGCTNSATRAITVHPLPEVNAGNDTTFCDQPIAQTLAGQSPQGGAWSGPYVTPAGIFTPGGEGEFTLHYGYTDENGCTGTDAMVVVVAPMTVTAVAGSDTAVCLASGLLHLQGSPAGGSWSGDHVNATGGFDPVASGSFVLTYSVGGGSCMTQDQLTVTVHPLPAVAIVTMPDACEGGDPETFSATPLGGVWSGTGITDTGAGTFDPATAGQFTIAYTYTDAQGCTGSDSSLVEVFPLPVADFSHGAVACSQAPFAFQDQSSGASSWVWAFGDGQGSNDPSPSHTYTVPGNYTVTLTVATTAGCSGQVQQAVTVWEGPTVAFSLDVDEGCGPLAVTPGNQSFGDEVSYLWDIGLGGAPTATPPGTISYPASAIGDTTYTIQLTASNFCGSQDSSLIITVHPVPTALFGPDLDHGCSPWPVTFSNVSIGLPTSHWWDFGDGTTSATNDSLVQHTYYAATNDSTYTVTLAATNACGSDTAQYTITARPNTVTAFFNTDTTSGCAPLTVNFTQYSIGVNNWHWDLGDTNFSTAANVSHTYTQEGVYTATLFGDNGCSYDTASVTITVYGSPAADFTITPGLYCVGTEVQFTNNTAAPAGLQWNFGDGGSSTLTAPVHAYAAAGTYTVGLSVASTTTPCPATASHTITVLPTPVAGITTSASSGCTPFAVNFQAGGTADFHQWDFGDGNTSGAAAPGHTYLGPGNWNIRLVAENANGCTDTAYTQVISFPVPISSFNMAQQQSCTSPVHLQLTSTALGAVGHAWDFGNGTGSVLNDPVATFGAPGTYTIGLTVQNQYGCMAYSAQDFTVHPTPLAVFSASPQPACAGYPVTFHNHSLNAESFVWHFDDGSISVEDSPVHTFAEGDHAVQLIASGAGGCADTVFVPQAVQVHPSPTAAFSYTPMQSTSYALQFHNQSTGATSWHWDFGDGDRTNEFEPYHLFPAGPGDLYPFCLVAVNDFGCPDTLCLPIVAENDPNIWAANAFTPDGDGVNEDFRPVLNGFLDWRYRFLVFDRWGELIHETRDRWAAWDGNSRGRAVPTGVYVWKVVLNRDGDERVFYGHVTVVRGSE